MQQIELRAEAFCGYPDCLLLTDRNGTIFEANQAAIDILGYGAKDLLKLSLSDLFSRPTEASRMPSPESPLTEERVLVVYMIPRTGVIDATDGTLRLIPLSRDGRDFILAGWQSSVSTATHEALLIERHRYRSLFEQAHDAVFIVDLKGNHLEANQRATELLGYTPEEISRLSVSRVSADPDMSSIVLSRLLAGETIAPYERAYRRKDGSTVDVEINVELVRDGHGRPVHIQSMARDITERKQAVARIRELADQRELLLREVYHRVKNSMATVISMLDLEADAVVDEAAKAAMSGVSRRVRSMQMVYDALFLSQDHQSVRLDLYLESLLERLGESFDHERNVTITSRLEPIMIVAKMTFAVGIVVNELVTNAYKYAFPGHRKGTVTVELSMLNESTVRLAVSDDGVGHTDKDAANQGFGTLMIESLVEQIRGTLTRKSENGTVVEILAPRSAFAG